jgi:hypothetical protein
LQIDARGHRAEKTGCAKTHIESAFCARNGRSILRAHAHKKQFRFVPSIDGKPSRCGVCAQLKKIFHRGCQFDIAESDFERKRANRASGDSSFVSRVRVSASHPTLKNSLLPMAVAWARPD